VVPTPQLATLTDEILVGEEWLSEIKFDGYRMLCVRDGGTVRFFSRNLIDWTAKLEGMIPAVQRLKVRRGIFDGELVVLDEQGRSSFAMLKEALSAGAVHRMHLYVFDLLHADSRDLRKTPQLERKEELEAVFRGVRGDAIRYSAHVLGNPAKLHSRACEQQLEGLICKRPDAPYKSGRTKNWLKLKCLNREEFVVLGWTDPERSRIGLGALHLGYYDEEGQLHYAGGVGTGFDHRTLEELSRQLVPLKADRPAKLVAHGKNLPKRLNWVKPKLVAEVKYLGWTGEKALRHSVFLGLREDKPPRDVIRQVPGAD
jgi:bifunctional non-homologous end joining protein LigD